MVFQQFLSCQITEEKITQLKQNPNQTLSKLNVFESCILKKKDVFLKKAKKKAMTTYDEIFIVGLARLLFDLPWHSRFWPQTPAQP